MLLQSYVFENVGAGKFNGFNATDELSLAGAAALDLEMNATGAERVYAHFNADDRPNGHYAPSCSVGDVITLVTRLGAARSYAVEPVGIRRLRAPILPDDAAVHRLEQLQLRD